MKHRAAALIGGLLLAAGVHAAAWQEGQTYTAGTVVDYNGKSYVALVTHTAYAGTNWNPASSPTLWQVSAGGTTPTTAPTATLAPTAAATATSKPLVTPTTVPGSAAAWDSGTVYNGGQTVSYNGAVYQAKWWTQGDVPGASQWGPWQQIGGTAATPTPTATSKPTATPTATSVVTISPTPTKAPVVTPTVSPTPIITVTPTATPVVTITPTPTTGPTPTPNPNVGTLPKHVLVGYWHNFTNPAGDTFPIGQVGKDWDVIVVAFGDNAGAGNVAFNLDKNAGGEAQFIADVAKLKSQGKKVVLSLGGQDGSVTLNTDSDVSNFVNSLYGIMTKYGFDGIDLDLEGGSGVAQGAPIQANLVKAVKQLKAKIGPNFYLSMAPEHPYVQGGYVSYGSIWGAYLPIIDGLRDDLTVIHVQYYNNGGFTYVDGRTLNEGTVDALVGGSLMLINGFTTNYGTGSYVFKGLRADQVAFGVPSGPSSAGRGFVTSAVVSNALTCLTKLTGCDTIKPAQALPDYRGVMTWSINWDKHDGYNFSVPAAAALKTLP